MGRKKKEIEPIVLKMNPIFKPLFSDELDDPRYYQVYGGRGSGKSHAAADAAVELTYSKYDHKILYLRQTMVSLEDSSIADVRSAINRTDPEWEDFHESKGVITNLTTGITISFKGIRSTGAQTAKLKSLSGITTLIIEEAEEVESFEEFSKIDEGIRVIGIPLKIIMLYNPTSAISSWIHKEWFVEGIPGAERHHDTIFLHSTYLDNIENLNASIVQRYRDLEESNPVYYRNTILAEWTLEVSGRLYAGWGQWKHFEEDGDVWYGLDFGYGGADKTSCIKITWFEGTYYAEEMFSKAKLSIRATLTHMRKARISFMAKIYADSAMPLLISEIREGGYRGIRKAKKGNVEAGIKKVQDKDIVMVGENVEETDLYYGYMTFRRDKKTNKLPHEPDSLAALRYGINSKKPTKNRAKANQRRRSARRIQKDRGDFTH